MQPPNAVSLATALTRSRARTSRRPRVGIELDHPPLDALRIELSVPGQIERVGDVERRPSRLTSTICGPPSSRGAAARCGACPTSRRCAPSRPLVGWSGLGDAETASVLACAPYQGHGEEPVVDAELHVGHQWWHRLERLHRPVEADPPPPVRRGMVMTFAGFTGTPWCCWRRSVWCQRKMLAERSGETDHVFAPRSRRAGSGHAPDAVRG